MDKSAKTPDRPWMMRTYAGHSSAEKSNELYRANLAKGQTGLSIAFDLPTQTGYDSDHVLSRGEVGKVGVPVRHIEDMAVLLDGIDLGKMNTSMTINATAAYLLALYIAVAERHGTSPKELTGTTQNDIIKEYLSRGTYIFPPEPSLRLIRDMIEYTYKEVPKWNPTNICSYHLQEAGATPVQEIAFSLANAITILDQVKAGGKVPEDEFEIVVGRISFFVNAGVRFIEEMSKMRAFTILWEKITRERYGVQNPKFRRFRYGVQVNSLGLTEPQPENNIIRIILETLAVTLSKDARARAIQLPAWNEALGLPRKWDQQWSLRIQQILAYESDLLEYGDIFNGNPVIEAKVQEIIDEVEKELEKIESMGGSIAAIDSAYMKKTLVESNADRIRRIENGEQILVGVNKYPETEESPLTSGELNILKVDPKEEQQQIASLKKYKEGRDNAKVEAALKKLEEVARGKDSIMPVSIECAHAGVTVGEWSGVLRKVFGEYRAPTGVSSQMGNGQASENVEALRSKINEYEKKSGRRFKILIGKPGLDGHSNGAEQIAVKARDCGMDVVYEGIRLTPVEIVNAAIEEGVHVIGLSILSGSHLELVEDIIDELDKAGGKKIPLIVGGIIPPEDEQAILKLGVQRVYTPKDYELNRIMAEIIDLVAD